MRQLSMQAWEAIRQGGDNPLQKFICQDPVISEYLPDQEIANLMNPTAHVGVAPRQARALAKSILEAVGN